MNRDDEKKNLKKSTSRSPSGSNIPPESTPAPTSNNTNSTRDSRKHSQSPSSPRKLSPVSVESPSSIPKVKSKDALLATNSSPKEQQNHELPKSSGAPILDKKWKPTSPLSSSPKSLFAEAEHTLSQNELKPTSQLQLETVSPTWIQKIKQKISSSPSPSPKVPSVPKSPSKRLVKPKQVRIRDLSPITSPKISITPNEEYALQSPKTSVVPTPGSVNPKDNNKGSPPLLSEPPPLKDVTEITSKSTPNYIRQHQSKSGAKSQAMKMRMNQVYPSTSPQAYQRFAQKLYSTRSDSNRTEETTTHVVPQKKLQSNTTTSKDVLTGQVVNTGGITSPNAIPSATEIKKSPGITQIPTKGQQKGEIIKSKMGVVDIVPTIGSNEATGSKALAPKKPMLNLTDDDPKEMKQNKTIRYPKPDTIISIKPDKSLNHFASSIQQQRSEDRLKKYTTILKPHEVPTSNYLQELPTIKLPISRPKKVQEPRSRSTNVPVDRRKDTPVYNNASFPQPLITNEMKVSKTILKVTSKTAIEKLPSKTALEKLPPKKRSIGNLSPKRRSIGNLSPKRRSIGNLSSKKRSIGNLSPKILTKLKDKAKLKQEKREKHLSQLHAKYNWKRLFQRVQTSNLKDKNDLAADRLKQKEAEVEARRIAKKEKKEIKKPKVQHGFLYRLVDILDEDEDDDDISQESESTDSEERTINPIQQRTLGERREERRGHHMSIHIPNNENPNYTGHVQRKGSDTVKGQQISAAYRRVRTGGSLDMDMSESNNPLSATNIENTPNYDTFTKNVRGSLPSTFALPTDDATTRLFGKLVPLLKGSENQVYRAAEAEEAFDEFRVAKIHSERNKNVEEELASIRYLPGNLEHRREVKTNWEEDQANETTWQKRFKYFVKDKATIITVRLGEMVRATELWHEPLHDIEMNFGVGVSTYFKWLRAVLVLNFLYLIFSLAFIVFPEIGKGSKNITDTKFDYVNFFLADSYKGRSTFFYGVYEYVRKDNLNNPIESPALRFVIVLVLIMALDTFFVGIKVRQYFKRLIAKVSDSDKTGENNFFALVLSAWDYNVTSKQAVKVQHRTIARDFNNVMDIYEKQLLRGIGVEEKIKDTKWPFIRHWIINTSVIIAAGFFGYMVYLILNLRRSVFKVDEFDPTHSNVIIEIYSSVFVGLFINTFSPICTWATSFETYKTVKEKIYVLVYRIGFFYISTMAVFYTFWIYNSRHNSLPCWEEETGTEIYRIMIVEGIANSIMTLIRYIIYPNIKAKWMKRKFEKSEFDVEYFTINLIFVHTLSGVGIFFFPLLPLLAMVRLFFTFYWKKFVLNRYCAYPTYQLHPSEVYAPYVIAFFFSYLCVTISNAWLVSEEQPSASCGPFTGYSNFTYSYVFNDIIQEGIGKFTRYFVTPWFLYCAILILAGGVYTFRSWTWAYFDTLNLLHDLLRLERLDREFLLRAMYSIPGIQHRKKSSDNDSGIIFTGNIAGWETQKSTDQALLIKQQEALAKIFQESGSGSSSGGHGGLALSISIPSIHSSGTSKASSGQDEVRKHLALIDTSLKDSNRPHKHLLLSSKALHLLRKNPRRLSKAGNIYNEIVGKVIEMNETDHREVQSQQQLRNSTNASIFDNKPAWSDDDRRPSEKS